MRRACVVAAAVTALLVAACDGRPRTDAARTELASRTRGDEVAVVDLSAGVPEASLPRLLGLASQRGSFDELVLTLQEIEADTDVKGVLVRFGGASFGLARATEVGELLHRIGASRPVYCHAEAYSNATLYAAARGCSRVSVSPAGDVAAIGIAAQIVYVRQLLEETLGLSVNILQVGKFKGAEEPFTRDGPSDEARVSLETTLSVLRDEWLSKLREGRSLADPSVAEDGPWSPAAARERHLVDEVEYAEDCKDHLESAATTDRAVVRFGPGASDVDDPVTSMLRTVTGDVGPTGPIAIVRASGSISLASGGGIAGGGGISEHALGRILEKLENDSEVKAVVLRIDSPGGSALASDLLWHRLMRLRRAKPLVVSVGEMAASGGYYLASTGSEILAEPTSIVGSIGVVGGKVAVGKAVERFGVHSETFPAKRGDARAAARAAYESPLTSWDEPTRKRVLEGMTAVYDLFVARVAEGRGQPESVIAASAEGRIFSGVEAKQRKLVDALGGLDEAIAEARKLAHLAPDARAVPAAIRRGLFDALSGDDPLHEASALVQLVGRSPTIKLPSGAEALFESLAPLAGDERNVASLPFSLMIQ